MSSSSEEWEMCVQIISSDIALLDALVRGAHQRYRQELGIEGMDRDRRAEAWSKAVREVRLAHITAAEVRERSVSRESKFVLRPPVLHGPLLRHRASRSKARSRVRSYSL